jgi:hypothetical protein
MTGEIKQRVSNEKLNYSINLVWNKYKLDELECSYPNYDKSDYRLFILNSLNSLIMNFRFYNNFNENIYKNQLKLHKEKLLELRTNKYKNNDKVLKFLISDDNNNNDNNNKFKENYLKVFNFGSIIYLSHFFKLWRKEYINQIKATELNKIRILRIKLKVIIAIIIIIIIIILLLFLLLLFYYYFYYIRYYKVFIIISGEIVELKI